MHRSTLIAPDFHPKELIDKDLCEHLAKVSSGSLQNLLNSTVKVLKNQQIKEGSAKKTEQVTEGAKKLIDNVKNKIKK